jgi:hypothetical protein
MEVRAHDHLLLCCGPASVATKAGPTPLFAAQTFKCRQSDVLHPPMYHVFRDALVQRATSVHAV